MNSKLDKLPKDSVFFSDDENYLLIHSKMQEALSKMEPNSVDCIITDPPYELNFMNKGWDRSGVAFDKSTWALCLKVLKPGGNIIVFGGSRTFSRISVAIEDAGFEVKDTLMWLYGSGFPKSMNVGLAIDKANGIESEIIGTGKSGEASTHSRCMKSLSDSGKSFFGGEYSIRKSNNDFSGYGTCLKPAYEPIIWAMKPLDGTYASNALKWGTAGINVKEARIADEASRSEGRFPSNVVLTFSDEDKSEVCGAMPEGDKNGTIGKVYENGSKIYGKYDHVNEFDAYEDEGSASRYFYCAKASTKDRDEGLELGFSVKSAAEITDREEGSVGINAYSGCMGDKRNFHPTVKPTELMQYLCRLFAVRGGSYTRSVHGVGIDREGCDVREQGKALRILVRGNRDDGRVPALGEIEDRICVAPIRIRAEKGRGGKWSTPPILNGDDHKRVPIIGELGRFEDPDPKRDRRNEIFD